MESLPEEKIRLTRRQSQRRDLSRVVLYGLLKCSRHERHASRQVPSWLIFDVSQAEPKSRCAAQWRILSVRVLRESFALWVARVRIVSRKEGSRCRASRLRVCGSESAMRATSAVPASRSKEVRNGFFARAENPANKAPEPTPGAVTPRATEGVSK